MFQPDLDEILEKVDCRYTLIVDPVSQAIEEINEGKVTYIRKDD